MPIHLRPTAPIAADAILPGDPGRALALAQSLLTEPVMSNHNRGLWGYYGLTEDEMPLTIQATGMGGPSAAIVLEELAGLGVRRAVRVGSCGALSDGLEVGDALRVEAALAGDGTSRALGANGTIASDATLDAALAEALPEARPAVIATTDLFYDPDPERASDWQRAGAVAVEMEAAALFQAGLRAGVRVACLLVVSDAPAGGGGKRLDDEELGAGAERLARGAVSALRSAARSG